MMDINTMLAEEYEAVAKAVEKNDLKSFKIDMHKNPKKKCQQAVDRFVEYLEVNKQREAARHLFFAFTFKNMVVDILYSKKFFRPSNKNFRIPTHHIDLLEAIIEFPLENNCLTEYLRSVLALCKFQKFIDTKYTDIRRFIKERGLPFLKTIMAFSETLFLKDSRFILDDKMASKETICEGVSFLIAEFFSICKKIEPMERINIDEGALEKYRSIICDACRIKQFFYAELLIGKMPYRAEYTGETLVITPQDPNYEKARIMGYKIHYLRSAKDIQQQLNRIKGINEAWSFNDISSVILPHKDKLIRLKTEGLSRYVLEIPYIPEYIDELKKIFASDSFFKEEIIQILCACNEFHVSWDKLMNFQLADDFYFFDLIKIRRYFWFASIIFNGYLNERFDKGAELERLLVLRSILLVYNKQIIVEYLSHFFPANKINSFFRILSCSPKNDGVVDIQYTPIIDLDYCWFFPSNILLTSDYIRNVLFGQKRRLFENDSDEPLVDRTYNCLLGQFENTRRNYTLLEYEIDCLSVSDNYIFVFEVKNTMLPCNTAEERTLHDYIHKATQQLANAINLIEKNDKARRQFEKDFSTSINDKRIVGCVIFGSRVFTGYQMQNFPIRYIKELENYLTTGVGIIDGKDARLWSAEVFHEDDLANFIKQGGTNAGYFDRMISVEDCNNFLPGKLVFNTFDLPDESLFLPEMLDALREETAKIRIFGGIPQSK